MMNLYCERCPVCGNECVREQHSDNFGHGKEVYKQSSRCPSGCYGYYFRYDEITITVGDDFRTYWEQPEGVNPDVCNVIVSDVVKAINLVRNVPNVTDPDQRAFLLAVRENPRDLDLRKVYADWLEDRGHDDEAAEQRAWTLDKEDGRERIAYLSMSCHVTFNEMLLAMTRAADRTDEWHSELHLSFDTPDCMYEHEINWKAYEDYTGRSVKASNRTGFVSCSC